jgi:hypothetical protein
MRLEMIAKIRAKTAGDGSSDIGLVSDPFGALFEERTKMEQSRASCDRKNLVAMEGPHQTIRHVYQGGESSWIGDGFGVDAIRDGWEGVCEVVAIETRWS